jgi:uncharacterized protein
VGGESGTGARLSGRLASAGRFAWGGHLMEAEVRPTLEVIVTESSPALHRRSDADSGLALLDL